MGKQTSIKCKAYIGTSPLAAVDPAGISAAGFAILPHTRDVKLNQTTKEGDSSDRDSNIATALVALLDISVDVKIVYDSADAKLQAIEAAYYGLTTISAAFLSDLITVAGSRGLAGNWSVTKADRDESLENTLMLDVTLKPADHMTHLVVAGS